MARPALTLMRVLIVARWYPSHDSPGRGSFVADQARALEAHGAEVVIASWEPALLTGPADPAALAARWARAIGSARSVLATPRSWGAGVPVARLPAVVPADPASRHPVDLARWQAISLTVFGEVLADAWPFDVVHAHTGLPDGVAAIELAERLGLPLLTTEHDGSLDRRLADDRARAAYRTLVADRRHLVAVSGRLADQAASLSGLSRTAIDVIPNLIDRTMFRLDPGILRDPNEALWVGTRKASKGMNHLLAAVAQVGAHRPALRLRMIGSAPTADEERRLETLAADLGIADRVTFDPPAPRREVAAAMARAGLFVHPSPSESFGIVAIEALATGLPVVACAPTILDLLGTDGSRGEAAAGPDAASLAEAMDRALDRLGSFDPQILATAAMPYGEAIVADRILAAYRTAGARSAERIGGDGEGIAVEEAQAPGPVRAVVVAIRRRSALDRIGRLAAAPAAALTIVTSAGAEGSPPPAVGGWIELDADEAWKAAMDRLGLPGSRRSARPMARRVVEALLHPRRTIERRRLFAKRGAMALEARAEAVRRAAAGIGNDPPIIALDADDLAVVDQAGLGARLAPGSLRWIADRADEPPTPGPSPT
jgi:glycosyltransferase involved in cell wall biosynthesis